METKKSKLSLYWKCQLIGWSLASLYWSFQGYNGNGFRWDLALLHFLLDLLIYIGITHGYRQFARYLGWPNLGLKPLLVRLIPALTLLAILYAILTVFKLYYFRLFFSFHQAMSFESFVDKNLQGILIAGIRLMAIWLLAYHLYHYAKREVRLQYENTKLALQFKQAQFDNLAAQLNPHFLFNSLNTIKSLTFTDPVAAARGIDLLAELLRSGLNDGGEMKVSLLDELSLAKDYLELEKLRLEERLTWEFDIDKKFETFEVPRLSVQTLVENAVKHGISTQLSGGRIKVEVTSKQHFLDIVVSAPGHLDLVGSQSGIGLRNLKQRLDICYQEKADFMITESHGLVEARIKIPLI